MLVLRACVIAALASFVVSPVAAQSKRPAPIRIGTLGGVFSTLWTVNNANDAVGWSDVTYTDSEHAILWQDGQLIDLGTLPEDTVSRALGINDLGQIVGVSLNRDFFRVRAVLWDHGQATEISVPGSQCVATAINNLGHIALRCDGSSWLWRDGEAIEVGSGYSAVDVAAINDDDVAVGSMQDATGQSTAFRWKNGVLTDIGALAVGIQSSAVAINARGQIAGHVQTVPGPDSFEPVIWHRGTVTPLSGAWGTFRGVVRGINNRGEVVGHGHYVDGTESGAFVWSRGTFRFLDPYFVVSDINERGTAVGRISEDGWAAEGVLYPKTIARTPPAGSTGSPHRPQHDLGPPVRAGRRDQPAGANRR